jgi:hypothetical protein
MATQIARYKSLCYNCALPIRPGDEIVVDARRKTRHAGCDPGIIVTRFASGATSYRNARGRCEDAPCCGCCSPY